MYNSFPDYTPIVLLFNHPLGSQLAALTSSDSHSVPIGVLLSCSCHTTLGICKQARCSCAPNFDLLFSLIAKPPLKFSTFPFKKIWLIIAYITHCTLSLPPPFVIHEAQTEYFQYIDRSVTSCMLPCLSRWRPSTPTTLWPSCPCRPPWRTASSWPPARPASCCPWTLTSPLTSSPPASPRPSRSPCDGNTVASVSF